ncbi:Rubisco LSMT substrate-binding [Phytophthora infestans]|uniref:Rubisco LSMT substrate-binding n=1 Tax=Phytophthora infestans TaxID=4787 RepID=A0A833SJK1_PHYIN|nr:Rubisco LSMT substrate-binding [Phytophthora infestans]
MSSSMAAQDRRVRLDFFENETLVWWRARAVQRAANSNRGEEHRPIVSLRNEFVFTRAVISTCTTLLKQYPTSIEQDQENLAKLSDKDDVESVRIAHVQRILIMEKQILNETMELALDQWQSLLYSSHPNLLEV